MIRQFDFVRAAALAALVLPLCMVAAPPPALGSAPHVPGELIVKYRGGTTPAERDQLRRRAGVRYAGMVGESSQLVAVGGTRSPREAAAELESDPRVAYARPNYIARASADLGRRRPNERIRGTDFAGTVEAVGPAVTRLQPGDEVYGDADGAFAEYVCAPEHRIECKPANLTFEQAAAVPARHRLQRAS